VTGETRETEALKWQRRFAAEANNSAWSLVELVDRTPAQTDEMLDAAHASAHLWRPIGTDLNQARSQLLLGLAHGLAGNGALATRYATASLEYFTRHECPDWEIAFVHAAMACAARAAGNVADHGKHYGEAARRGEAIANLEDRTVFLRTFDRIPPP
jgi:hypothetical protein